MPVVFAKPEVGIGKEDEPDDRVTQTSSSPSATATNSGESESGAQSRTPRTSHATRPNASANTSHQLTVYPTPHFPHPTTKTSTDPFAPGHVIHTHTRPFIPEPTTASPPPPARHRQSTVAIVFEVLAGVVGAFLIFMMSRCLWSWRRTPHRDRIESLLSRHYLEQEMEQRERQEMEQRILRSSSLLRPPPPPYQRAPSYEAIANCPPPPV